MSLGRCEEASLHMCFCPRPPHPVPSIQAASAWQGLEVAVLLLLVRLPVLVRPFLFRVRDLSPSEWRRVAQRFRLFFTHCSLNILTPVVTSTAFFMSKSRLSLICCTNSHISFIHAHAHAHAYARAAARDVPSHPSSVSHRRIFRETLL